MILCSQNIKLKWIFFYQIIKMKTKQQFEFSIRFTIIFNKLKRIKKKNQNRCIHSQKFVKFSHNWFQCVLFIWHSIGPTQVAHQHNAFSSFFKSMFYCRNGSHNPKKKRNSQLQFCFFKKKKKSNCIVTFHFGKEENKNIKNFIRQLKLFN